MKSPKKKRWSPRVPAAPTSDPILEFTTLLDEIEESARELSGAWDTITGWHNHPDPEIEAWNRQFGDTMADAMVEGGLYPFSFHFDEIYGELTEWYNAVTGAE